MHQSLALVLIVLAHLIINVIGYAIGARKMWI